MILLTLPSVNKDDVVDPAVFCISSRDYCKIEGLFIDTWRLCNMTAISLGLIHGVPATFSDEADTGIPDLQRHLLSLARPRYLASVKELKVTLHDLVTSLSTYLDCDAQDPYDRSLNMMLVRRWDSAYRQRVGKEEGINVNTEDMLAPRLRKVPIFDCFHAFLDSFDFQELLAIAECEIAEMRASNRLPSSVSRASNWV